MKTVGIREFRENLSHYLLESKGTIAITRHGETIGYYIPIRREQSKEERRKEERAALSSAHEALQKEMEALGITEDDILADFKRWRKAGRK